MNTRTLVLPALAAVLLTGCSAGTDPDDADLVQPQQQPAVSAPADPTPTQEAAPPIAPRLIEASFEAGQVRTAESRVEVSRGDQVVLRITSDVAEEVHVHGYDLVFDVPAGGTVEKSFTADLPGQWEVELHDAGRPMLVLKVA